MMRIGCGAGFSADRLGPACDLIAKGRLDVIIFECVGERTLAFAHRDRLANPAKGYNALLERRMRAILPLCRRHGTRLVTNMGAANPRRRGECDPRHRARPRPARHDGRLRGRRRRDVERVRRDAALEGGTVADVGLRLVGANAYIGSDALLPALEAGADVVIAGRVSDPSLVLAPLRQRFGWAPTTGSASAPAPSRATSSNAACRSPAAISPIPVSRTCRVWPSALSDRRDRRGRERRHHQARRGGRLRHDPHGQGAAALRGARSGQLPDARRHGRFQPRRRRSGRARPCGPRRGGRARAPAPAQGHRRFDGGFLAEGGISYAGPNAGARARLARDVLEERLRDVLGNEANLRLDLIGISSLHGTALEYPSGAQDVRVRAALRSTDRDKARDPAVGGRIAPVLRAWRAAAASAARSRRRW